MLSYQLKIKTNFTFSTLANFLAFSTFIYCIAKTFLLWSHAFLEGLGFSRSSVLIGAADEESVVTLKNKKTVLLIVIKFQRSH